MNCGSSTRRAAQIEREDQVQFLVRHVQCHFIKIGSLRTVSKGAARNARLLCESRMFQSLELLSGPQRFESTEEH